MDQAGLLSAEDRDLLALLGDQVHTQNGAELAVVTIRSTAGQDHRRFATELFNAWRLGDAQRNNGLLLFVAIDDRAAEIILGDGIDSDAEVAKSDRIMQDELVARFRRGDPAGAIVAGARACAREFFGIVPPPLEGHEAAQLVENQPGNLDEDMPAWVRAVLVLAPTAGLGLLGAAIYSLIRRLTRKRPRACPSCRQKMTLLGESADDAHLDSGEKAEERVGSVDYDIWLCPGCGTVEKRRFGKWFSGFSKCPQCKAATAKSTSRTIRSATSSSSGLAEIHERCSHCGYQNTYTRSIPSTGSSSSSSSSGGGSSSGRGSSGRW